MVDIQLILRVCETVGVGPADTANGGQGGHRVGSDRMGYLSPTGAVHDFHNSSTVVWGEGPCRETNMLRAWEVVLG